MCYVNREQSATTGALVEAQPFGGWKYSGRPGNSRAVRGTPAVHASAESDCGRRRRTALDRHSNRRTDLRPTVRLRNIPD